MNCWRFTNFPKNRTVLGELGRPASLWVLIGNTDCCLPVNVWASEQAGDLFLGGF